VIAVPIAAYRNSGLVSFTVADNQGNTYILGADSGDANGARAFVYYAYNIASSGTFTITVTWTGPTNFDWEMEAVGIEYFGFGTANPLVGSGTNRGNGNAVSVTTAATGAPEVAVIGVETSLRLNFNITSITVGAVVPAYTQEYEHLTSSPITMGCEADSRVDTTSGAQALSWTVITSSNWGAAIIALYSAPPTAVVNLTQQGRHVLEQELSAAVNLTQMARQVLYRYTCVRTEPPSTTTIENLDKFKRWGIERFDIKVRSEGTS
jgi:hypothetical protein